MTEVKAIVLFWKSSEHEKMEELLGEELNHYPDFAWRYLQIFNFPNEKWAKNPLDDGLVLAISPVFIERLTKKFLDEEWIGGYVYYQKRGMSGPSLEDIRNAFEEGKILKLHPLDHLETFKMYCYFRKKLDRLKNELETKIRDVIGMWWL